MKFNYKKLISGILLITALFSLSGCALFGNGKRTYASYIQSLLDVNYKAEYEEYMQITGATQEEAQKVYDDGLNYLADALMSAYGVNEVEGSNIHDQFVELAGEIYSHASYEVQEVTRTDGVYHVTVMIYPIDILKITYEDVIAYIEDINNRVSAGEYNDYELDEYETEYAQGIIDILKNAIPNIGNGEGVAVTVTILDNEEYYYISDADFLALDKAILETTIVEDPNTSTEAADTSSTDTDSTDTSSDTADTSEAAVEPSSEASEPVEE